MKRQNCQREIVSNYTRMSVFRNSLNQKRGTSAVQKPGNAHNSSIR
ncbi:atp-binding cassette transporter, partial [Moniliophthora roreri]